MPSPTELTAAPLAVSSELALKAEMGPLTRVLSDRYFSPVRFSSDDEAQLRALSAQGLVVHVMRTTAWVNYVYLTWASIRRGLPPVRAVVNLRRWFTRPWRRAAQTGPFEGRFRHARATAGSALIFLRESVLGRAEGRATREDPFPSLVALARKEEGNVFLVPELFVWEAANRKLKPTLWDQIFGSPEAPGFLHTVIAFWRHHQRASFRVGQPIDVKQVIAANPGDSDEVLARKIRGSLHLHLARETRAVFGPPMKTPERLIDEAMRDRTLRRSLEAERERTGAKIEDLKRTALKNFDTIAAKPSPLIIGAFVAPILRWVFNRLYDGIDIDVKGLERAMKAARQAPIVLCPSHKSHADYLLLGYVMWISGYPPPLVAAGANLSFFPLGILFRRMGAFFLRRSFKADKVYTAVFRAYLKKLVRDGIPHEFFPEGGRSRTGKLLTPKLGLFTWHVDALLEGASEDLIYVPVSLDYEKVMESATYSKELAGAEKKTESVRSLLGVRKVLTSEYGRIHVTFGEPLSVAEVMKARGLDIDGPVADEPRKGLVRNLAHRVMYGISRVSTVTPHALVSAALLTGPGRGVAAKELAGRVQLLRRIAEEEQAPMSAELNGAPSDPNVIGPIQDAIHTFVKDEMLRTQELKGELILQPEEAMRTQMAFYKHTLMNLVASRSIVATALVALGGSAPRSEVQQRALELSRLFKFEFIYRVGMSFESIFAETVERLAALNLVEQRDETLGPASHPDAAQHLLFLRNLLRDFIEAYYVAGVTLEDVARGAALEKKSFVKAAQETGKAELLAGRIAAPESMLQTWLENAVDYFVDVGILELVDGKRLKLGPAAADATAREQLLASLRGNLLNENVLAAMGIGPRT